MSWGCFQKHHCFVVVFVCLRLETQPEVTLLISLLSVFDPLLIDGCVAKKLADGFLIFVISFHVFTWLVYHQAAAARSALTLWFFFYPLLYLEEELSPQLSSLEITVDEVIHSLQPARLYQGIVGFSLSADALELTYHVSSSGLGDYENISAICLLPVSFSGRFSHGCWSMICQ